MFERVMWKMRDGTMIAVVDMTDSHLLNTIHFCERVAERKARQEDSSWTTMWDEPGVHVEPEWFLPRAYSTMISVAQARGLDYTTVKEYVHFGKTFEEGGCRAMFVKTTAVVEEVTCPLCLEQLRKE